MVRQVLLVEDQPQDVLLTREAFEQARRPENLVVTSTGEEALDYLYRRGPHAGRSLGDPSLILLDLGLPGMNGLEVLRRIKADPEKRHIPVVVVTISDEPETRVRSYDVGSNAFVTKPQSEEAFVNMVSALALFWLGTSILPTPRRLGGA